MLLSAPRAGGGSDGNFTVAMGIPTLDGLGVDGDGAHTNHEHMLFSSIEPRTRLPAGADGTAGVTKSLPGLTRQSILFAKRHSEADGLAG